jgi:hypothetical protein
VPHRAVLLGLALAIAGGLLLSLSIPQIFWEAILMIIVGFILIFIGIAGFANRVDSSSSSW